MESGKNWSELEVDRKDIVEEQREAKKTTLVWFYFTQWSRTINLPSYQGTTLYDHVGQLIDGHPSPHISSRTDYLCDGQVCMTQIC